MPATITVRCPICGQEPGPEPWRCPHCEAPHHHDCAAYFGSCGIFGCRDGHLPAPMEKAHWPEAVRLLERYAAVRRQHTWLLMGAAICVPILLVGTALLGSRDLFGELYLILIVGSLVPLICITPALLAMSLRADQHLERATARLVLEDSASTHIAPRRLRHAIPRLGARWSASVGLIVLGLLAPLLGALLPMVLVGRFLPAVLAATALGAGFLIGTARELSARLREMEVVMNRIEATQAPLLAKGRKSPQLHGEHPAQA